ncbi:MAG TPA: OmpA family protein [Gemmatimonadaceae bacterium]|jgi:peptidoglycan-associated lipoprotein|nr:OmpA family protein [Gemmatimonadaceae bacterium]
MTRRFALLSLALLSVAGLDACKRKVVSAPTPVASTTSTANEDSLAALRARQRADSIAAADAAAARNSADAQRAQSELAALLSQKVYFDYDRDVLRDDARAVLDAKVPVLLSNPGVSLLISGHTDERGTAEYNLALGQRRAAQVKRYLSSKGVPESRLTAQSLGDAQPAVQGSDESAYQQNRRAEFEAQGASALARPRS